MISSSASEFLTNPSNETRLCEVSRDKPGHHSGVLRKGSIFKTITGATESGSTREIDWEPCFAEKDEVYH
jgi:hypothetical protein